jgi:hypothetical protein
MQSHPLVSDGFLLRNTLEYACSVDGCEKAFIIDHIDWLRTATFTELGTMIRPLILGNGSKVGE